MTGFYFISEIFLQKYYKRKVQDRKFRFSLQDKLDKLL